MFLGSTAWAETSVKEGAQDIGQGLKTMGTKTGQAVKEGGKEVGEGLKKVGKGTGEAVKDAGEAAKDAGNKTVSETKRLGKTMWGEAKRIGRSVSDWCSQTYQKTVSAMTKYSNDIRERLRNKAN
jgi:hypothetical protein